MSLAIDSLVTDLMFQSGDGLDPEVLVEVLGGQEELAKKQVVDPDMQDPQFEMQLSPSMPFRRRDERRLMIIDDSVAPMRTDPQEDSIVPIDLRPAKAKLIELCTKVPIRLGRLFALGSWGDAVWVVRNFRDLRAVCLISWALDPTTDVQGRRRAAPLGQQEFEEKLMSYDKRLDELDDDQIRDLLEDANVEEIDDLIVVDVLEEDGTWDTKKSLELESKIAAIDRFSTFVGAKSAKAAKTTSTPDVPDVSEPENDEPEEASPPVVTPLRFKRHDDSLLVIFSDDRFDLEVAAALGKQDWDSILSKNDPISGSEKDQLYRQGADFIAPVEFLSEVFVDGKPLSKPQFEAGASSHQEGLQSMKVHFPRFGPVLLITHPDGDRFVSSKFGDVKTLHDMIDHVRD